MNQIEDLNAYQSAYKDQFKFFNENQWYLAHYAKRMCDVIRTKGFRSLLSLGIGHEVVSNKIMAELDHSLISHTILEGSENIIQKFSSGRSLDERVSVIHTWFEHYTTQINYDGIELGFVLEHVDNPLEIVKKYRAFLKPGGTMFIAVPNARSLHRLIGHKAGLLDDVFRLSEHDHALGHKRYFDLESITELIENAGLQITHTQGLMLKPITGDQIQTLQWGENIIKALFTLGDDYPEIANCILIEASI